MQDHYCVIGIHSEQLAGMDTNEMEIEQVEFRGGHYARVSYNLRGRMEMDTGVRLYMPVAKK